MTLQPAGPIRTFMRKHKPAASWLAKHLGTNIRTVERIKAGQPKVGSAIWERFEKLCDKVDCGLLTVITPKMAQDIAYRKSHRGYWGVSNVDNHRTGRWHGWASQEGIQHQASAKTKKAVMQKLREKCPNAKRYTVAKNRRLRRPWQATLTHKGKRISAGYFRTAREAAIAHDELCVKLGKLERLNFPKRYAK